MISGLYHYRIHWIYSRITKHNITLTQKRITYCDNNGATNLSNLVFTCAQSMLLLTITLSENKFKMVCSKCHTFLPLINSSMFLPNLLLVLNLTYSRPSLDLLHGVCLVNA